MSNVFEENKIEKNILVLHPMGYETEIARSLDNNLNNIKVHWKNSINNFHFSTYDAFMISLDFFDEDDESTIMQFLEELYKTNKSIVLVYNSYDKIEGKAISYLKNKFKVEFEKIDNSVIDSEYVNYRPASEDHETSLSMISNVGIKKAFVKNTNNCFILKINNVSIIHDMPCRGMNLGGMKVTPDYYDLWEFLFSNHLEENEPDWLKDIKVLDEKIIEKNIEELNEKLNDVLLKRENECQRLKENNEYKKVLYTGGDELVSIVKKMLFDMLKTNITDIDVKKEDLSFILGDKKILVEVKGVNTPIKREHVSQIQRHIEDDAKENNIDDEDISNKYKGVLIINPYIKTPVRERISKDFYSNVVQGDIKHYNICTLDTITFLSIFQKYKQGNETIDFKNIILSGNYIEPDFSILEK